MNDILKEYLAKQQPQTQENYPILVLKAGRERSLLNRHPWVFSGAVKDLPTAENGDIVQVQDSKKNILGYGFFDTKSQITVRLFEFNAQNIRIDEAYWHKKIKSAYELRKKYVLNLATNAYRLLHAEGDFLPGIIVDVYNKVAVVQVLIKGIERVFSAILGGLQQLGLEYIYLKTKENTKVSEDTPPQTVLPAQVPTQLPKGWLTDVFEKPLNIIENNLKFPVDVVKGQKTGFFLDQRENRLLLQYYSKGKNVLNAFSYTGGFSVYALAGGAKSVHSVDISKDAIAVCEQAVTMNFGKNAPHTSVSADCFDFLKKTEEIYDIIVLDPPAFAKNAKSVHNATRGYKELNLTAFKKIAPGGLIFTFSCSGNVDRDLFRKVVFGAAADAHRQVRILHQLSQPADHPINIYHPEGEYLKGLVLQVE